MKIIDKMRNSKESIGVMIGIIVLITLVLIGLVMLIILKNTPEDTAEHEESVITIEVDETERQQTQDALEGDKENSEESSEVQETVELPPENFRFGRVKDSYFDDALFVGDSRTVGLQMSGHFKNADFFAKVGVGNDALIYNTFWVDGKGNYTLESLLQNNQYGKIYVMSGVNQLYAGSEYTAASYERLIGLIRNNAPDAIIYIESNIPATEGYVNNNMGIGIDKFTEYNDIIKEMADNEHIFFLDISGLFETPDGYLDDGVSPDGLHIANGANDIWAEFIQKNAYIVGSEHYAGDAKEEIDEAKNTCSSFSWYGTVARLPKTENSENTEEKDEESSIVESYDESIINEESVENETVVEDTSSSVSADSENSEFSYPSGNQEDNTGDKEESSKTEDSQTEESTQTESKTPPEESQPAQGESSTTAETESSKTDDNSSTEESSKTDESSFNSENTDTSEPAQTEESSQNEQQPSPENSDNNSTENTDVTEENGASESAQEEKNVEQESAPEAENTVSEENVQESTAESE